ncbi:hypothetical protein [Nonomuraea gerenzanensis]|uniref:hypothetical protein n=1 Tax=Nonomuraea gerenzanensis TaxID=93944 RepID=UPI001CDA32F2|nr:hypothetical protein [Nonomuraea gerenzanensis]UBU16447.1 hypothetical protein LCN96_15955 [Nonomuraea gerenzanensis]
MLRVRHTSCCGLYEFASGGGVFFVLRRSGDRYEETNRGRYRQALNTYIALVKRHHAEHLSRKERPEPDTSIPTDEGRRGEPS